MIATQLRKKDWVTLESGTHVFLDGSGNVTAGPSTLTGKPLTSKLPKPGKKPKPNKPTKPANKLPTKESLDYSVVGKPIQGAPTSKELIDHGVLLAKKSPEIHQAVKTYTDTGYVGLNKQMRSCPPKFKCVTGENRKMLDNLEKVTKEKLPKPTDIYRGIKVDDAVANALMIQARKLSTSGGTFQMPSMTSATTNPTGVSFVKKANLVFQIRAKTGLPVEGVTSIDGEHEVIQSPSVKYKVVGVSEAELGKGGKKNVIYLQEE